MSGSYNQITIVGNLGSDPDSKTLGNGSVVCNFSVATSRSWKDDQGNWQEATQWHRIVCWNKLAENCAKHLHKGRKVLIAGEMTYREYEHQGQKRQSAEIKAMTVTFLDKSQQQGGQGQGQGQQQGGGGQGGYGGGGQGGGQGGYGGGQQANRGGGGQGQGGQGQGGYGGGGQGGQQRGYHDQPQGNQQQQGQGNQPQGGQGGGGYSGGTGNDGSPYG